MNGCLGAGRTGENEAGSYAWTSAEQQQIADKLYSIDAVNCREETTCATEDYERQDCGTHTFTIEGCISVHEKYDTQQNNNRSGKEKASGTAHKEQKIALKDNVPCAIDVPCVCDNRC